MVTRRLFDVDHDLHRVAFNLMPHVMPRTLLFISWDKDGKWETRISHRPISRRPSTDFEREAAERAIAYTALNDGNEEGFPEIEFDD